MIQLEICQGTTCYVMGAAYLATWASNLPEDLKDKVSVKGSHCLGLCTQSDLSSPPYVKVDGEVIMAATPERVLAALRARLEK